MQYLHLKKHRTDLCAGFLVLFFVFLLLSLASYFRIFFAVQTDPGLVPLRNAPPEGDTPSNEKRWKRRSRRNDDPEQQTWAPPDPDLDSPGLEAFYSQDVFVCEVDGRPKWCSDCRQWKPDRAHHSSEMGRCVRKMDHMCPWVGGMVSETCE